MEVKGKRLEKTFRIADEYTGAPVVNPVKKVFETDSIVIQSQNITLISKDGTDRAVEVSAAPIKASSGVTNGCVVVFRDISERNEIYKQIKYLSYHDQLTGMCNRRYFEAETKDWIMNEACRYLLYMPM
jgi:signal transduction histidine kinase